MSSLSTVIDQKISLKLATFQWAFTATVIWNLGTHEFRYDFTIFFIYMNSYMNS